MGARSYGGNANSPGDSRLSSSTTSLLENLAVNNNTVTTGQLRILGYPRIGINVVNSGAAAATVTAQYLQNNVWVSLPAFAVGAGVTVFQTFNPIVATFLRVAVASAGVATSQVSISAAP